LTKINEYKHKIETKIPQPAIERKSGADEARLRLTFRKLPILRYVGVGGILVAVYAALRAYAVFAHG
jgi:hypothetical protein